MKKKVIGIICLIMLLIICCIGCGREEPKEVSSSSGEVTSSDEVKGNDEHIVKNDNIQFADVTMKKYVLKELGKKPDEEVTYKEANQLKSLTIDRTYRNFVTGVSNISMQAAFGPSNGVISMDLSDLQYFTGLESLEIDNSSDDNFIGWESIEKCTDLKELKVNYYEDSRYIPLGEKPLLGFVSNLKNLQTLDCMYGTVTPSTINKIKTINPLLDIKIEKQYSIDTSLFNFSQDKIKSQLSVLNIENAQTQASDTLLIEKVNKTEEYKEIIENASASEIKYIYIKLGKGAAEPLVIDCKDFLQFTNLETLSITETSLTTDGKVENIKELSKLPYLTTFCVNGDYNPDEICELKHVDTLTINGTKHDIDLSSMTNLKKVSVSVNGYNVKLPSGIEVLRTTNSSLANTTPDVKILCDYGAEDCKLEYLKNCPKLRYLYWNVGNVADVDLSVVKNVPELEYLGIGQKKITSGFEALSELKKLRVVQLRSVTPDAMAQLKDMKSKESLGFFGFLDWDGKYPDKDYQEALGISGSVNYMNIYYNVPEMVDLYKSGVTNTQIMQAENTSYRDEYGYNETFGTIK